MTNLTIEAPPVPLRTDENGVIRVGKTRIPLATVVTAWKQGESLEQIVDNFDTLDLADVYGVINYYLSNRVKIEAYLTERAAHAAKFRAEMEGKFPPDGIRARLLARLAEREFEPFTS